MPYKVTVLQNKNDFSKDPSCMGTETVLGENVSRSLFSVVLDLGQSSVVVWGMSKHVHASF